MDRRQSDYSEAPAIGRAVETDSKSYDRVYGMLLGIRVHVSRISAQPLAKLQGFHFNEYEKIDIPREGNHYAPAHHGNYDYKFKTYAPVVFMHLRHLFGITDDEYLVSLTADYMMSELKTIGRSGAMFFYTWDGRYVLKTLTKDELAVLRRILPKYYQYVSTHPDTLVNQFFGVYRSQTSMGRPIRFVIMNNVFPIGFQLKYKFDLKGSTVNRHVAPEKKDKPGVTMKDTEFAEKRYLSIGPRDWTLLRTQLLDDTNFLSSCGLMDYSLLIGIHQFNPDSPIMHPAPGEKIEILSIFTPNISSQSRYNGNSVIVRKKLQKHGAKKKKLEPTVKGVVSIAESSKQTLAVMPFAPTDKQKLLSYCGGLRGSTELDEPISEVYFIGIIDFLQSYNSRKKAEHAFKSIVYAHDQMSCVPPDRYAARMFDYLVQTIGPEVPLTQEQEMKMLRRRERLKEMAKPVQHSINSVSLDQPIRFNDVMRYSNPNELKNENENENKRKAPLPKPPMKVTSKKEKSGSDTSDESSSKNKKKKVPIPKPPTPKKENSESSDTSDESSKKKKVPIPKPPTPKKENSESSDTSDESSNNKNKKQTNDKSSSDNEEMSKSESAETSSETPERKKPLKSPTPKKESSETSSDASSSKKMEATTALPPTLKSESSETSEGASSEEKKENEDKKKSDSSSSDSSESSDTSYETEAETSSVYSTSYETETETYETDTSSV